jgi:hypothetical protein
VEIEMIEMPDDEVKGEREQLGEVEPGAPSSNGTGLEAPGQDLVLERGGQQQGFNVPRELIVGSADPAEFLARTILSERELARDLRILMRHMEMTEGFIDVNQLLAWKYTGRPSIDGRSRAEVVAIATSGQYAMQQQREGRGMFGRSQDINKEELEGRSRNGNNHS